MRVAGVEVPACPSAWRLRWMLFRTGRRRTVAEAGVDCVDQPEVVALVRDVAATLELAEPDSIVLVGFDPVRASARPGWRQVRVPVPLLPVLSVDELRVLVARELAVLAMPRADLICRLRDAHSSRPKYDYVTFEPLPTPTVSTTERLISAVERYADAVAASVGGPHLVARALVRADTVNVAFGSWAVDLNDEVEEALGLSLLDIHDGWQIRLDHNDVSDNHLDDEFISPEGRAAFARAHEGLAAAISDLDWADVAVVPAENLVPLRPVDPETQAVLAEHVYLASGQDWATFDQIPDEAWNDLIARSARLVLDHVAKVLGYEPSGPAEAVDVVLTRNTELAAVRWPESPGARLESYEITRMAIALAEHTMTQCGWRRKHPVVTGLMTRPGDHDVDLRAPATRANTDTGAADELRQLLDAATRHDN